MLCKNDSSVIGLTLLLNSSPVRHALSLSQQGPIPDSKPLSKHYQTTLRKIKATISTLGTEWMPWYLFLMTDFWFFGLARGIRQTSPRPFFNPAIPSLPSPSFLKLSGDWYSYHHRCCLEIAVQPGTSQLVVNRLKDMKVPSATNPPDLKSLLCFFFFFCPLSLRCLFSFLSTCFLPGKSKGWNDVG